MRLCARLPTLVAGEQNDQVGRISMPKLLPGIVGCAGAVVIASENSSPEAVLVLKLRTESGQEVFLPISEVGARQVQKVIGEFNRGRDFLFVEEKPAAEVTLQ
jgi:hypothetical protein